MGGQIELFEHNNPLLPRSAVSNPAFLPRYGFNLSVNTRSQFTPGGVQIYDIFRKDQTPQESLRSWFSDSSLNFKNIRFDQEVNLLEIGIRSRRSYIHMSSKIVTRVDLNLDKDLFGLAFFGNGDTQYYKKPTEINLSGTQFRVQSEHRMSYGRRIGSKLYLGVSAKVIHGLARLRLDNARFQMLTDTSIESIYSIGVRGDVDATTTGFQRTIFEPYDPFTYLSSIPFANYGLAYGGGLIYRPFDFLRVSFATENQGFTEWNYFGTKHKLKVDIPMFSGLDTIGLITPQPDRSLRQELQDTIDSWYSLDEKYYFRKETNTLRPRYNFSLEYLGFPRHRLTAMVATGMGARSNVDLWAVSEHFDIKDYLQLYVSYARFWNPIPQNVWNVGFSTQVWGLQLYGQLNNLLAYLDFSRESHYYSGQIGVNINFTKNIDSDGDDIPDHRDRCKFTFGTPKYRGCPKHMFRTPHIIDPKTKRLKPIRRVEERFK